MKHIFLLLFATLTLHGVAQLPVGHMSINFKDAARTSAGYTISGGVAMPGTGRTVGAEVYYPATTAGNNTMVATGQFPVVVFGHGFAMGWDSYDNIYNRLASLGYIVVLPRTEGGIFPSPSHTDFGADLKFLAEQGLALNTASTPASVTTFNSKVLQKSAIGGHSMGAGSSFIAGVGNTAVTCVFNFAAATTNPSSVTAAAMVTVPTLIISGQKDAVADTTVQNSHYNATAASKKFHVIIKDLTHCDVGNGTSATCSFGQATCNTPSCNSIYFGRYMGYLEPFLASQLKSDCAEGQRFMDSITVASVTTAGRKITGTLACPPTAIKPSFNDSYIAVYPNPAHDVVNVNYVASNATLIELYDVYGKLLVQHNMLAASNTAITTTTVNLASVSNGMYVLVVTQQGIKKQFKIIKSN